ncbi:zf-TFIIB domain-containing protein [Arthrobacter roseus]|uniref:TFIIB-type zinc ribbon-containing protein n=1 Tax=Arthrobacter roseus TaxID=136274 RepID=UPI001964227C|nr:zf-TFIIB domain-containing protein [Arthrobacter roseus]MBM7847091.1 Zn-finger nucleic acid-binding protein [Arthrobacter roseus]
MKCPLDGSTLVMSERSGIEIDYCPECRGVWLDRGELDKIIDRAAADSPAVPQPSPSASKQPMAAPPLPSPTLGSDRHGRGYHEERDDDRDGRYGMRGDDPRREQSRGYDKSRRRKKDSFLGDLFDF